MFVVQAKINNGDPCPKREYRAWEYEEREFETLEECIMFLIEVEAVEFFMYHKDDGEFPCCRLINFPMFSPSIRHY